MTVTQKVLGILFIVSLVVSYMAGVHSVDVSKTKVDTISQDHTQKTIVTIKKPDGSSTTTETVDSRSTTKTDAVTQTPTSTKQKTNISVLVGNDFSKSAIKPMYGVSGNREFIGNLTVGAYGLTNGTVGLSLGLNF